MKTVVIADAGPLIGLARIGQLHLLPQLFGTVIVTDWVAKELIGAGNFPDTPALADALAQPWLQTVTLATSDVEACKGHINLYQIDMGEASALVMAQHSKTTGNEVLVIMDETRGRAAARHMALTITGTAGILLLAKTHRIIKTVKPLLDDLKTQGYFVSRGLTDVVLRLAGEESSD